ncbi:hypothetical protein DFH28DRAFT_459582 [Melampsora americana]|nr:hypothetical protein DFH28DRAFT_459582 [Melampsora americana]
MSFNFLIRSFLLFTFTSNFLFVIGNPGVSLKHHHQDIHERRQSGNSNTGYIVAQSNIASCNSNSTKIVAFDMKDCDDLMSYIVNQQVTCAQYRRCAFMLMLDNGKDLTPTKPNGLTYMDLRTIWHQWVEVGGCTTQVPFKVWNAQYGTNPPRQYWCRPLIMNPGAGFTDPKVQRCDNEMLTVLSGP